MTKWPICKLSSVLRIQNGFAFDSKQFSPDGSLPLIRIRDLKNGASTETNFNGEFDPRNLVRAGDFLIGMDGEFGCYEWRGPDALLNQRVCKLTDFAAGIEPRFLFYGINKYLKDIEDATTFTTVKHLSSKQIGDIGFPFPPLEEQRRIVSTLDGAFAAIATATANTEKNLANARELFPSYLRHAGAGAISGRLVRIGDCATVISGQHIDAKDYNATGDGIGYLTGPSDFGETYPTVSKWTLVPKRTALPGDILITVKGSGVGSINMMGSEELAISRQLMAVRSTRYPVELIYFALEAGFDHFQSLANGTAIPGISRPDVLDFEFAVPDDGEIDQFMKRLNLVRESAAQLREKAKAQLARLTLLKQSILHRAFNGELVQSERELVPA